MTTRRGDGCDGGWSPYPLGELGVHHEVVHVFFCFGELQFPGHHGYHKRGAAGPLQVERWGTCQCPPHVDPSRGRTQTLLQEAHPDSTLAFTHLTPDLTCLMSVKRLGMHVSWISSFTPQQAWEVELSSTLSKGGNRLGDKKGTMYREGLQVHSGPMTMEVDLQGLLSRLWVLGVGNRDLADMLLSSNGGPAGWVTRMA